MLVALIIFLATLENMWPLIAGYLATPKDTVFLGTTHYAGDYFYYLSQFAQGKERLFTTIDLYTSEKLSPTIVGWVNVALGRVFSLFGVSAIPAYHASIALLTVILLLVSYTLICSVLKTKSSQLTALYLFVLYHAFPMLRNGLPSYGDYFNNFAVPRVRFGAVPHQHLLNIASIIIVVFVVKWSEHAKFRTKKHIIAIIITSGVLASLQPILWGLLLGIISISTLIQKPNYKQLSIYSLPPLLIIIGGLFPILYLSKLFSGQPFIQLKIWEAAQQTPLSLQHFVTATGPIFLAACISLPFFLKPFSFARLFTLLFALCSFILFLSPLPAMLDISHVRFMSTLAILCISIIAAYGITRLSNRYIITAVLVALTLYLVPNHITSLKLASNFNPKDAFQYLSEGDYSLLLYAEKQSTPNDTFLVIWPYNVVFPALSGRRSYHGHALLTINPTQKNNLATQFFSGKMTESMSRQFLDTNHITYIIGYSWSQELTHLPYLLKQYSSGNLTLYKIQ